MQKNDDRQNEELSKYRAELELAHLQIRQLQEEMEVLFLRAASNADRLEEETNCQSELGERNLNSELSLALLQIDQLQKELEVYYKKYLQYGKSIDLIGSSGVIGGDTLRVLRLARLGAGA